MPSNLRFLGDAWERSYGELAFRNMEPERIMPWYLLATDGATIQALGVMTGPAALCFWQRDPEGISLWCDLRNGGQGVQLGARQFTIAEIIIYTYADRSPFQAAHHFCARENFRCCMRPSMRTTSQNRIAGVLFCTRPSNAAPFSGCREFGYLLF